MDAGGELSSNRLHPIWLALGTGILLFLSFPGVAGFWPLAWIALIPLLLAIKDVRPRTAARLGLLAGMVHYYGNLPLWVSVPALFFLALYMSGYLVLFCLVINRVWQRQEIAVVWLGPLLWVGLDYIRSFLFSGFPWQDLAYSQYKALYLIQTADLAGHYGITFHIVLVNSVTALLIVLWNANRSTDQAGERIVTLRMRRAWLYAVLPALFLVVTVLGYNVFRYYQLNEIVAEKPKMKIAIVQGSIEQDLKWSPAMRLNTIDIYTELSEQAKVQDENPPELFVWPETAMPFLFSDNPYFRRLVDTFITKHKTWLLTGAPYYEEITAGKDDREKKYISYNSAYLIGPDGSTRARYDKQHLGKDGAIGVLICFESIFPELARDWTYKGANLLVNITNDGWYGRSSAPWQHLSMSVFRAVENRRSLIRSANTGISAFIDPLGRIIKDSPLFQPFYLVADMPLLQTGTLFVSFGHYFGLLCLVACLPFVVFLRDKR